MADARGPGQRRPQQGDYGRDDDGPGPGRDPQRARRAAGHDGRAADRPDAALPPDQSGRAHVGRRPSGRVPVGAGQACRSRPSRRSSRSRCRRAVTRVDQAPASTVTARHRRQGHGRRLAERPEAIDQPQADGKLPGVTVTLSGVTEQMNTAFSGLFVSMAVAILLVYIVMVLVFNSLIDPLVIMFSLPLATIGAFPALFLTGRPIVDQRAHRLPDAHRDRRDQRDRVARPRRAVPAARHAHVRGAHPGRPDRVCGPS